MSLSPVPSLKQEVRVLVDTLSWEHAADFAEIRNGDNANGQASLGGRIESPLGPLELELEQSWTTANGDNTPTHSAVSGTITVVSDSKQIELNANEAGILADKMRQIRLEYENKFLDPLLTEQLARLPELSFVRDARLAHLWEVDVDLNRTTFSLALPGSAVNAVIEERHETVALLFSRTVHEIRLSARNGFASGEVVALGDVPRELFENLLASHPALQQAG